jgi:Cyclin
VDIVDEEVDDEVSDGEQDSDNEFGRSEDIDLENVEVGASSKTKPKSKPIISKAEAEQIIAMSDKIEKKKAQELKEQPKIELKTEKGFIEALKFKMRIFDYHYDFPTDTMSFIDGEELQNPTLEELYYYCKYVIISGRMEKEIPILCLIYLERFFTKTGILMNYGNWKRLTLISLILASKIWDDDSLENVHFP